MRLLIENSCFLLSYSSNCTSILFISFSYFSTFLPRLLVLLLSSSFAHYCLALFFCFLLLAFGSPRYPRSSARLVTRALLLARHSRSSIRLLTCILLFRGPSLLFLCSPSLHPSFPNANFYIFRAFLLFTFPLCSSNGISLPHTHTLSRSARTSHL